MTPEPPIPEVTLPLEAVREVVNERDMLRIWKEESQKATLAMAANLNARREQVEGLTRNRDALVETVTALGDEMAEIDAALGTRPWRKHDLGGVLVDAQCSRAAAIRDLKSAAAAEAQEADRLREKLSRLGDRDTMHPTGSCSCGGEGRCQWCLYDEVREERDMLRAEVARLRDILDVERRAKAPEGWKWSPSDDAWRSGNAWVFRRFSSSGSWEWDVPNVAEGSAPTALEAIEAADAARGTR